MDDVPVPVPPVPSRLSHHFRLWLRRNNYRYKTEQTYMHWISAFVRFHKLRDPREMGGPEIEAFLTHLSTERHCSVGTQKVALNALNCFYRKFLGADLPQLSFRPARRKPRVPVVFTDAEARAIIDELHDPWRLMAEIMYGSGLRVSEMLRLRIKDVDFGQGQIVVREGKGNKDCVTMLPQSRAARIRHQIEIAEGYYVLDRRQGG